MNTLWPNQLGEEKWRKSSLFPDDFAGSRMKIGMDFCLEKEAIGGRIARRGGKKSEIVEKTLPNFADL